MSAAQTDIFGGAEVLSDWVAPCSKPSPHPTCWNDCLLCGKSPLSYRGKVFYHCTHPNKTNTRCFEGDVICNLASRRFEPPPAKPQTAGWDDY